MYIKRPMCVLCAILGLILFIFARICPPATSFDVDSYDKSVLTVTGEVRDKYIKDDSLTITLGNCTIAVNGNAHITSTSLIAAFELKSHPFNTIKIGQKIRFRGKFYSYKEPENEGEFNTREYYAIRAVDGCVKECEVISISKSHNRFKERLMLVRNSLSDMLAENLSEEDYGVMNALILGNKNDLDDSLKENYRRAGIAHVLSLSGLHIATLGLFLLKLLKRTGMPEAVSALISSVLMACYAVMTGLSTSTLRALIMFAMGLLASVVNRTYDLISASCASCIIILMINPYYIIDTGFQLSFGAVLGIAYIYPLLGRIVRKIYPKWNEKYGDLPLDTVGENTPIKRLHMLFIRTAKSIAGMLLLSVSINLATLPIIASSFYTTGRYGFAVNLIVVPLMTVVLACALVGLATGGITGAFIALGLTRMAQIPMFMRDCAFGIDGVILKLYKQIATFSTNFPYNTWVLGQPSPYRIIAYYSMLILSLAAVNYRLGAKTGDFGGEDSKQSVDRNSLRNGRNNTCFDGKIHKTITVSILPYKRSGGTLTKQAFLCGFHTMLRTVGEFFWRRYHIAFALVLTISVVILTNRSTPNLEICNFSVGQGDCALVLAKDSPVILIDCGSSSNGQLGKYTIIPALCSKGIARLDYVFITHPDKDHISGIIDLLSDAGCGVTISNIVISEYSAVTNRDSYSEIFSLCRKQNIPVYTICSLKALRLNNLCIECLWPYGCNTGSEIGRTCDAVSEMEVNDASLVLKVTDTATDFSALFTGDIGKEAEDAIVAENMNIDCDYLKVAHHGSRDSSSADFLSAVSPQIAVISAGRNNSYGHPHKETLKRLYEYAPNAKVLRTDECGQLTVKVDRGETAISRFINNN